MDELACFDTEQLEAELKRRKEEEEKRNKPQRVPNPDWSQVQGHCQTYIDNLYRRGYTRDDDKQYIFEAALAAVFGENVWRWINSR